MIMTMTTTMILTLMISTMMNSTMMIFKRGEAQDAYLFVQ